MNSINYLFEIQQFHAQFIEPYLGRPCGSTEEEVGALEREVGYALPEAYRQYLLWMGKDYHGIFAGSDWFLSDAASLTAYLPRLLEENECTFALPKHYLSFFGHQGYIAAWFSLPKEDENPPVYFFSEASKDSNGPITEGTFTDLLFKDMRGLASLLPGLRKLRRSSLIDRAVKWLGW